jgi:hypothetical protein
VGKIAVGVSSTSCDCSRKRLRVYGAQDLILPVLQDSSFKYILKYPYIIKGMAVLNILKYL